MGDLDMNKWNEFDEAQKEQARGTRQIFALALVALGVIFLVGGLFLGLRQLVDGMIVDCHGNPQVEDICLRPKQGS